MVPLGKVLRFAGVPERINDPDSEMFVTVRLNGHGAVRRNIGAGKTPVAFTGYRVRPGQFIYSRIDARNGAFAIVPPELEGAVVSKDFPVFEIQDDIVDTKYLIHFFIAGRLQRQLRALSQGATNRQRITEDRFLSFTMPLPALTEQRRIAAILDHAYALRAKRRQVISHLDDLAQSIFIDMFGDGDRTYYPVITLSDVTSRITYGFTNPMSHVQSGIPIVTAKSISNRRIDLESGNFTTAEEFCALTDKSRPREGDVLVTKDGTIGRCAVVKTAAPFCINQSVALVRPRLDTIEPNYLVGYLSTASVQSAMNGMGKGNALKHLQITELAKMTLPCPPKAVQRTYVKQVAQVQQLRTNHMQASDCESGLFASLQSRAFLGEL